MKFFIIISMKKISKQEYYSKKNIVVPKPCRKPDFQLSVREHLLDTLPPLDYVVERIIQANKKEERIGKEITHYQKIIEELEDQLQIYVERLRQLESTNENLSKIQSEKEGKIKYLEGRLFSVEEENKKEKQLLTQKLSNERNYCYRLRSQNETKIREIQKLLLKQKEAFEDEMRQNELIYHEELKKIKDFHGSINYFSENKINDFESEKTTLLKANMELREALINRENFYKNKIEKLKGEREKSENQYYRNQLEKSGIISDLEQKLKMMEFVLQQKDQTIFEFNENQAKSKKNCQTERNKLIEEFFKLEKNKEKECEQLKRQCEELQKHVDDSYKKINEQAEKIGDFLNEIIELKTRVQTLSENQTRNEVEKKIVEEEYVEKIKEQKKKYKQMQKKMLQEMTLLKKNLLLSQTNQQNLKKDVEMNYKNQIKELKEQNQSLTTRITKIQQEKEIQVIYEKKKSEQEIEKLQRFHQEEIKTVLSLLAKEKEKEKKLLDKISIQEQKIEKQSSEKEMFYQKIEIFTLQNEKIKQKRRQLEEELQNMKKFFEINQQKMQRLQKERSSFRVSIDKQTCEYHKKLNQNEQLFNQVSQLKVELNTREQLEKRNLHLIESIESQNERLKEKREELEEELILKNKQIRRINEEQMKKMKCSEEFISSMKKDSLEQSIKFEKKLKQAEFQIIKKGQYLSESRAMKEKVILDLKSEKNKRDDIQKKYFEERGIRINFENELKEMKEAREEIQEECLMLNQKIIELSFEIQEQKRLIFSKTQENQKLKKKNAQLRINIQQTQKQMSEKDKKTFDFLSQKDKLWEQAKINLQKQKDQKERYKLLYTSISKQMQRKDDLFSEEKNQMEKKLKKVQKQMKTKNDEIKKLNQKIIQQQQIFSEQSQIFDEQMESKQKKMKGLEQSYETKINWLQNSENQKKILLQNALKNLNNEKNLNQALRKETESFQNKTLEFEKEMRKRQSELLQQIKMKSMNYESEKKDYEQKVQKLNEEHEIQMKMMEEQILRMKLQKQKLIQDNNEKIILEMSEKNAGRKRCIELEHQINLLNSQYSEVCDELEYFKNEWKKVVGSVNNVNEKIEKSSSKSIVFSDEKRSVREFSTEKYQTADVAFAKKEQRIKKSDSFVVGSSDILKSIEKSEDYSSVREF